MLSPHHQGSSLCENMCEYLAANWQSPEMMPADGPALAPAGTRHLTGVDGELVAVGQVDAAARLVAQRSISVPGCSRAAAPRVSI